MTYFDSNSCSNSFHYFLRDDENIIHAFHPDDSECKGAEFDFADMLNDEVDRIYECPQCGKRPAEQDHIKQCIGYSKPYSADEIRDSLSDPTEQAKRDILLS